MPDCFVIMPISDPEGYLPGHFKRVFEDIFVPACLKAGFQSVRADQIRATNLIHLDILQRILEAPVALCDLSSRNPNVLFELGLRQAFDRPVVLVQESETPQIFDIAPLRYTEYRRARLYHEVLEDQRNIAAAITATMEAHKEGIGINSLVKILSLTKPASLAEVQEASTDPGLQIVRAEIDELRREVLGVLRGMRRSNAPLITTPVRSELQYRIVTILENAGDEWMTLAQIAEAARMGVQAVKRALEKLFERGLLAQIYRGDETYYGLVTTQPRRLKGEN
ncbi:MAG: hypothetical protein QOH06_1789 [Acidobacteriota bacterium]|nr:hypothetical protein [Acidobacteriota bacterium]